MRRISIVNETGLSAGDVLRRVSTSFNFDVLPGDFRVTTFHDCKVYRDISKAGNLRVRVVAREDKNGESD